VNQQGQLCELFATGFVFAPSKVRHWMPTTAFNFYEAKSLVQACLQASGASENTTQMGNSPLWQPQYQGQMGLWDLRGFEANLGWLHLDFTQRWFKQDVVFAAECVWLTSRIRTRKIQGFQPYPEGPTITKDLALWVAMETPCETVRQELLKRLKKCVQYPVQVRDVRVFDVFIDAQQAKKSLAFSLVFGAAGGGTLTDAAVQEPFDALQLQLAAQGVYQIRKLG
jgi:phenylalanyl-tRNA synthetase beta subunit